MIILHLILIKFHVSTSMAYYWKSYGSEQLYHSNLSELGIYEYQVPWNHKYHEIVW